MNAQHAVVKPPVVLVSAKHLCRKAERPDIVFATISSADRFAKVKVSRRLSRRLNAGDLAAIVTAVTVAVEPFDPEPNRLISRGDVKKVEFKLHVHVLRYWLLW